MTLKVKARCFVLLVSASVSICYQAEAQSGIVAPPTAPPIITKFIYNSNDLQLKGYASRDAGGSTYRLSRDGKILTISRPVGSSRIVRQYDFGRMTFAEVGPGDKFPKDVGRLLNVCDVDARDAQEATQWISHHLYAFDDTAIGSALKALQGYVTVMPGAEFSVNAFRNGAIVGSISYRNYGGCGKKTEEIAATSYIGDESLTLDFATKTFTWNMFRSGQNYAKVIGPKDLLVMHDALKVYLTAHMTGIQLNLQKNPAVTGAYDHELKAIDAISKKLAAFTPVGQPGSWSVSAPSLPGASLRQVNNTLPAVYWPLMPRDTAPAKHWPAR